MPLSQLETSLPNRACRTFGALGFSFVSCFPPPSSHFDLHLLKNVFSYQHPFRDRPASMLGAARSSTNHDYICFSSDGARGGAHFLTRGGFLRPNLLEEVLWWSGELSLTLLGVLHLLP